MTKNIFILASIISLAACSRKPSCYDSMAHPFSEDYIVPSKSMGGNILIGQTADGTPILNINAPNEKGVSVNYFTKFNITSDNLIINNNNVDGAQSVLGGRICANLNFIAAKSAPADKIIIQITDD